MEWLSQNWIWLALAVGVVLMMRNGAAGGGCCGGGHGSDHKDLETESSTKKVGAASCCGGGHGAEDTHPETVGSQTAPAPASPAHNH